MKSPWQFTLRQLFWGVAILCVCVGLSSRWYWRYRAQDAAMDVIEIQGAHMIYPLDVDDQGRGRYASSAVVNFIAALERVSFLDRDMFFQVIEVSYEGVPASRVSNEQIAPLPGLIHLKLLDLTGEVHVTDRSVPVLARMKSLEYLSIYRTGITPRGAAELRAALPDARIFYEPQDFDE